MFNMAVQIALPDPSTTTGQFTINVPIGGDYSIVVLNNQVFMQVHIQSLSTIPANPPTQPSIYQYRALNTSWRDDTATQFNSFVSFVTTTTTTYVLTNIVPVA